MDNRTKGRKHLENYVFLYEGIQRRSQRAQDRQGIFSVLIGLGSLLLHYMPIFGRCGWKINQLKQNQN